MAQNKADIASLTGLARAQFGQPGDWSLAVDAGWLERSYFGPGVIAKFWELAAGELIGSAAVAAPRRRRQSSATVVSMLRLDREDLWGEQHEWIEAQLREASAGITTVTSESLTQREVRRWTDAGFRLVFEELVMERDLDAEPTPSRPRWPAGSQVLEWGLEAADAGYRAYVESFRDRPGFPGWSRSEWIDRLTGGDDFLASASMCVLMNGVPAGFVVCTAGWIDQLGVAPTYRRIGIASALAGEAVGRMWQDGIRLVRLHVNVNNPDAIAAWSALGWRDVGRRGRLERGSVLD